MKKIYFVRHGESEGNAGPLRQDASTPLTEKGREQALFMAKRAGKLPIERLVASPMVRAMETAEIIAKEIGLPITNSDLFVERRRPSISLGRPKDDPEMLALEETLKDAYLKPGFRHSDEENFEDLKDRAREALGFLAALPEKNILVVTHGLFLRIVLAYVVFGETLNNKEGDGFVRSFRTENTGLSMLGYDEKKDRPWWVWVWNDHAHLG